MYAPGRKRMGKSLSRLLYFLFKLMPLQVGQSMFFLPFSFLQELFVARDPSMLIRMRQRRLETENMLHFQSV